ncbi:uncharacterized protein LOC116344271 [Contarinia nasturtii]|uniref:uncharacterized protein LOC116344271 n=1 Tax=Contarinia nasturtii TaxID=265458 RepID=UPI0012D49EC0|nr:uncharacterized protein LOC116344271 [Contarinia nasturtii]XP_031628600.1 uncharacterized protein LOC116344271 [Contarinia nasturtii]XP_031628601.1 uncharacterized protein LOC116344271 [Contarinia nasturtii]
MEEMQEMQVNDLETAFMTAVFTPNISNDFGYLSKNVLSEVNEIDMDVDILMLGNNLNKMNICRSESKIEVVIKTQSYSGGTKRKAQDTEQAEGQKSRRKSEPKRFKTFANEDVQKTPMKAKEARNGAVGCVFRRLKRIRLHPECTKSISQSAQSTAGKMQNSKTRRSLQF